jgi:hypothetical protein
MAVFLGAFDFFRDGMEIACTCSLLKFSYHHYHYFLFTCPRRYTTQTENATLQARKVMSKL